MGRFLDTLLTAHPLLIGPVIFFLLSITTAGLVNKGATKMIKDNDIIFLLHDIYDYLTENVASIGTNIKEEFPFTYKDKNKILLCSKHGHVDYVLTIKKGCNNAI